MTSSDFMEEIFSFDNNDELIQFEAETIHLDLIHEIQKLMDAHTMNKSDLAEKLNTSKGYITQLFTGDRLLNLKTLAKIQRIFDVKLKTEFMSEDNFAFDRVAEKWPDYRNVIDFPTDATYDSTSTSTFSGKSLQKQEAM